MLAAFLLFIIANSYPVLALNIAGIESETTLTATALMFIQQGYIGLAAIVWLCSVLIPGFVILGLLYVLVSARYRRNWPYVKAILRLVSRLLPWAMLDVFFLGVLVALVKLSSLAEVVLGAGFAAFMCLIVMYAFAISSLEMHMLWDCIDEDNELSYDSCGPEK